MQKQEIPPVTPCHSGCDLALNQFVLLQAISRPPWRHYECSFNSRGPLWTPFRSPYLMGGRSRRSRRVGRVISRCGNQRAAGGQCCVSSAVKYPVLSTKGSLQRGQEGLVPFDDRCTALTLSLLSCVVFCC